MSVTVSLFKFCCSLVVSGFVDVDVDVVVVMVMVM